MKKLKRLSLAHLANEAIVLTQQEQMEVYAGSGIDGLCVFEAMGNLNSLLGGSSDYNAYMQTYASEHGGYSSIWETSVNADGSAYFVHDSSGNVIYKGVDTPSATSFVQEQFNATQIGSSDYMSVLSQQGHYIFTDLYEGNGTSHAVVVYSFDPATGKYRYYDDNGFQQEATADQLNTSVSMDVYGMK